MSIFNKTTKSFQWGQQTVTLETGEIARQSGGAVVVSIEDTVILATVVARKDAKPGQDFFPLTVDYIEKTYAAGKIPGSFFKREGRPSELETLTSRLIDRPLRPLFPEGKQALAPVDHLQQAAPAVVVFQMGLEVRREFVDPVGEQGDLHLGRPGIGGGTGVHLHDLGFVFGGSWHLVSNR